jgi:hypothetical protein
MSMKRKAVVILPWSSLEFGAWSLLALLPAQRALEFGAWFDCSDSRFAGRIDRTWTLLELSNGKGMAIPISFSCRG